MLSLDFIGPANDMQFYLPKRGVSILELISDLTPDRHADIMQKSELCDVALGLPHFEMRGDFQLNGILSSLGISSLENADFSPMELGLQSASAVHRTSVKIDDQGAEMGAVTGGWIGLGGSDGNEYRKITIDFNRPFVYIVRNRATGAILMAGAVTNP